MVKNISPTLYHLIFQTLHEVGVTTCILIMKKSKLQEVKGFAYSHTANNSRGEI